ncbi:inositol monophosphatase [Kribbella flavida DSM 17836]|uniref:Inositol-1-monophosphatase n=1 Tax=Kribbella flavida (strain DSM 17836 / JCM 10339 / NBRC 14399) TaxID=479435 RepID=D2PPY3_KRIFD|nr:inositol monophosphatase family protein [Kribbella flavida]ADB32907.1 inositol monophosphatase [Kribbella flavida DSM 17836]
MTTTPGTDARPDPELTASSRELRELAGQAVRLVADDLRAAFRGAIAVQYKRDRHDPVTEHDRRAEKAIAELLTGRAPGSTVVGEEDGTSAGNGAVTWYVDPIDGTANFAHGLAFFCTSIGAVVHGRIVAGAVLDPVADHLFTADLTGAWLNGRPLRSRGVIEEAQALLITSYPNARALESDGTEGLAWFGELVAGYGTVRRPGSAALSLCHVAAGWADAALGTSVSAWDICAARLIVEQSGGRYHGFGGSGWDQPGYAAHTADLEPTVLRGFVDAFPARPDGEAQA